MKDAQPVPGPSEDLPEVPTTKRPRPINYAEIADTVSDLELEDTEDSNETPFDLAIQTCVAKGVKPRGIMAILNSVIIGLKLNDEMFSLSKIKKRIKELYDEKIDDHDDELDHLTYIGYDEREDVTLFPNCKVNREPHMTMVDINGNYLSHAALYPKYDPRTKKVVTKGAINYSSELLKILDETDSRDSLLALASDGTNANTGATGGANRYVEVKLERPLLYVVCVFHGVEKTFQSYFLHLENVASTGPFYNGPHGKLLKDGVALEPIVQFEKVPGLVGEYPEDFINSMNNDLILFYELCIAIQTGVFSESLMRKKLAKCHKARWITLASNLLRLYAQTSQPHENLIKMVRFILNVYAPVVFDLKWHPHLVNGSVHIFNLLRNARQLLSAEDLKVFHDSLLNNNFMMNHELILVALLGDPDQSKRQIAFDKIIEVRKKGPSPPGEIREFEKPSRDVVNFDAAEYHQMIKWSKVKVTEPPVTFPLSEKDLLDIVDGEKSFKSYLGNMYCHTQSAERAVANTTLAAATVVGQRYK